MSYGADPQPGFAAPGYPQTAAAGQFASAAAAAVVDASGLVIADVPCRKCSYNVRGLAVHGRCPECGTPVGVSVHGDLLRFSDPGWLQRLARGAALLFWGIILSIAIGLVVGAMVTTLSQAAGQWPSALVGIAGGLVQLYGAWLLTEPDPSGIGEDRYGTARKIIRVSLLVGLGNQVLNLVAAQMRGSPELLIVVTAVALVAGIIGLVGQFAVLRYLERLSLRIPDYRLSARARFLFWAYGGTLAVVLVLGGGLALLAAVAGSAAADLSGLAMGLMCFVAVAGITLMVFGIMFLVLLWRLKSAFEAQARFARQVWAGSAQPPGAV